VEKYESELAQKYLNDCWIEIVNFLFWASALYIKYFLSLVKEQKNISPYKFKPKKNDVIYFEIIIYFLYHLDLAIVNNKINDRLRTLLLNKLYDYIIEYFQSYSNKDIYPLIMSRLEDYSYIHNEYSSRHDKKYWEFLHFYFTQLILHAEKSKTLIKWKLNKDPVILDIIKNYLLLPLPELEENVIIFEKVCRELITTEHISNVVADLTKRNIYVRPREISIIRITTRDVHYLGLSDNYYKNIFKKWI